MIFAALAIHALKPRPEFATPSIVGGIRKLISLFDQARPGSGCYDQTKGRIHGNKITAGICGYGAICRTWSTN